MQATNTFAANRKRSRMSSDKYIPGSYWDEVARQIKLRKGRNLVAGDDEPYYKYKRNKFLTLLNSIKFAGKKVLEVGSGPGGNLLEIYNHRPAALYGADISDEMIELSQKNTGNRNITVVKTNGSNLPFSPGYFDIVITATVLQHIPDEKMLTMLIENMCRVAATDIYIFERIERKKMIAETNTGRTVNQYAGHFTCNNFYLYEARFAYLHTSYTVCGFIRKIFNRRTRREGEPETRLSAVIQKIVLPLTKMLDNIFKRKRDLAMLHFKRAESGV
jgi:ubiquinone/menaquinone biosynthesis C-methylase UbiE